MLHHRSRPNRMLSGSLPAVALAGALWLAATPAGAAGEPSTNTGGWPMYDSTYSADRFSPLKQITRENVGKLHEVGRYQLPETTSFQSGPLVVGDTLYVTTAKFTYAVNAASGKPLWSHEYEPGTGLGTGIRGAAHADGRTSHPRIGGATTCTRTRCCASARAMRQPAAWCSRTARLAEASAPTWSVASSMWLSRPA